MNLWKCMEATVMKIASVQSFVKQQKGVKLVRLRSFYGKHTYP